jgi:uncharacterized protein YjeT (DUF2065 family)
MPVILVTQEADQEDRDLKPAWANSAWDPILKKPITKMAGGVAEGVGPELKPQYWKKKKSQWLHIVLRTKHNLRNIQLFLLICGVYFKTPADA